ncbi:hypothetical protein ThrDRAFT_01377 [Frankia casuarinae]|nr:hypothetical protein CcI6DRAFT_02256 [Frankia sp. CcI6]EYT92994.1 hypothetical protein ThrDRAFT_01377 [Frankia casuarinae]KDA43301.1 hypothetical protein BMG523Draft_01802 [Frankia sp. BMG5.23]KFB03541.1 hypothetical protein ALLO2DRAFT_03693 [Frankia sp. Allo2]OAA22361.1 hypothetical protein AAY23_106617 [Frankia casuarinae]
MGCLLPAGGIDGSVSGAHRRRVGDVGRPERIVEDEPISFPDSEPLTIPVPAAPEPDLEPVPG